MNALVPVVLSQFPMDVFENSAAFKEVDKGNYGTLFKREVKGSPYPEHRVEVVTETSVSALCQAVYDMGTSGETDGLALHKTLKDEGDVRVVYEQLAIPVVSNRDYAMTVARWPNLEGGKCRIRFRATNDAAPKLPEGYVRMDKLWGEWLFEPTDGGKTKLTYTMFSDPSGAVPPFLVQGSLLKAVKDSVNKALAKGKAAEKKK
ncbi:MAG: hypothetical protein DI536_33930 [Archangium gephyra]|uniref:START domain-containing protein n=1 Tax=Archangium gephyra TaxID=48 RepID=A0A2W5SYC8_9BACT|nr:MAG: hypothetical protein DI536_33930 [Archangium gephyra]